MIDSTSFLLTGSLVCGLAAGVIAGMFGVGGGILIVPSLLFLFYLDGINPVISMQLAVGTSLATIVITNLSATWGHHRRNAVHWSAARQYIPGCLLGAWIGSQLAAAISGKLLILMFGLFEIFVGFKMIQTRNPKESSAKLLPEKTYPFVGVAIGTLSSLFGIGGGTLSVPALTLLSGLPMQQAVGTSSAIGIPLALAGSLGFIQAGWHETALPPGSVGFLVPVAFAGIVAGTLITTPIGVRLAHSLDPARLRKGFGFFLLLVGIKLLWR
ncbi:MAG: sulfite exporter TauE/SafE family protein [Magnetococcales bacterium]|nr:sulfite exporter TauE/SafE family protein [Magnetococcales bacterium]